MSDLVFLFGFVVQTFNSLGDWFSNVWVEWSRAEAWGLNNANILDYMICDDGLSWLIRPFLQFYIFCWQYVPIFNFDLSSSISVLSQALHHPFTAPNPEDMNNLASARALAYDMVYNGVEVISTHYLYQLVVQQQHQIRILIHICLHIPFN